MKYLFIALLLSGCAAHQVEIEDQPKPESHPVATFFNIIGTVMEGMGSGVSDASKHQTVNCMVMRTYDSSAPYRIDCP